MRSVSYWVEHRVLDEVRVPAREQVRNGVWDEVWWSVGNTAWDAVQNPVGDRVRDRVLVPTRDEVRNRA